ncbi:MAG: hypothetical protein ABIS67_15755 [Candidatus Eisenbacteria bacterium]
MPRAPLVRAALTAAALGAIAATPLAAGPRMPQLTLGIGGTGAVAGDLNNGGFAVWGAALWPVEGPWSVGVTGFVDDMGNRLVRVTDGATPPVALGTVEDRHRFAFGGGWQMNARLPNAGRWEPVASAFWSVARIQDDARGTVLGAESTTGLGLGLGIRRPVLQRSTVGVAFRYQHLFNDIVESYMSGGVEWGWRFGKTP